MSALLLANGVELWTSTLEPVHAKLARDVQWRVRRSLASSLHIVAAIVGTASTEKALVPLLEAFLTDIDEVKHSATRCFTGTSSTSRTTH